jgi:hypothetical protein
VGFRQVKAVADAEYADEVLDRYESVIFTCGKFIFGQSVYDKVLKSYSTPMTFKEYLVLSDDDQVPIDTIVKERTVARLIIKNSLNDNARQELAKTYSVNNHTCYPNSVCEALSLLATFKTDPIINNRTPDPVVSYHETADADLNEVDHQPDIVAINDTKINDNDNSTKDDTRQVTFDASVMASIIEEARTNAGDDQFIGASFAQLQRVDDVYEDYEPDIVCCAHVVDVENDKNDNGVDIPDYVADANNIAKEHNEKIRSQTITITMQSDFLKDLELMVYHTAQRVMHNGSRAVSIVHYGPGRPDIISHTYGPNIPELIIDYSDVLRFKFKKAGIHDVTTLMPILSNRTDTDAMAELKLKFNAAGLKGINTSTVKILREEINRSPAHCDFNCHRYHNMEIEIGVDSMMKTFPTNNTLLHHVVSCVAITQGRRKPNRWVNKITQKLIEAGITSIGELQSKIDDDTLNECLNIHDMPRLHTITITGFTHIMGTQDFCQGRS